MNIYFKNIFNRKNLTENMIISNHFVFAAAYVFLLIHIKKIYIYI